VLLETALQADRRPVHLVNRGRTAPASWGASSRRDVQLRCGAGIGVVRDPERVVGSGIARGARTQLAVFDDDAKASAVAAPNKRDRDAVVLGMMELHSSFSVGKLGLFLPYWFRPTRTHGRTVRPGGADAHRR
jgi:hypothetical protein